MDYNIYLSDPISRIDNLVNNFEKINVRRSHANNHTTISHMSYTNFSVSEILKPDFRRNFTEQLDSDSDGTRSVYSSEHYSSGEEDSQSNGRESSLSQSPEYIHNFDDNVRMQYPRHMIQYNMYHVFNEEDGFSSDSSENETALDLRIQRKKTPPKMAADQLPAWVYCTRYSDRPSAGPRVRKPRQKSRISHRRNRTAFNSLQIDQLISAFQQDTYLSETRRTHLANELGLNETSVKIWFQNQRAKTKKDRTYHPLADRLAQDGLYNHRTVSIPQYH